MTREIFSLLGFLGVLYFVYRRFSEGFGLDKKQKRKMIFTGLAITLLYMGSRYATTEGNFFYSAFYVLNIWVRWVYAAFVVFTLETGLSKFFPSKRRRLVYGGLLVSILLTALDIYFIPNYTPLRGGFFFFIAFLMNLVFYIRIASGLELSRRWRGILLLFLWVAAVFIFLSWFIPIPFARLVGLTWLGVLTIGLTLFGLETLVSLLFRKKRKQIISATLVFLVAISGYSIYCGSSLPVVKEITIPMKNLPVERSGFTIVQLSDLHIDQTWSLDWFHKVVDMSNNLKPDLVVITGDFFDGRFRDGDKTTKLLKRLESKFGTLAVLGNHEYYVGIYGSLKILNDAGLKVLRNESIRVDGFLEVAGVDDETRGRQQGGPSLAAAFKKVDEKLPVLFLSHRPYHFDEAREKGAGLQLSGHTHAGQIPPITVLIQMIYRYPYGLYKEGDAYIYTSCGTRLWGMPMRLFSHNEIVKITLVPAR